MLWWCMFMCKSRNEKTGKSPLTIHNTHSIVQVKPVATALAVLGIQTHDTSLGAFFTLTGHLVGKGTRWTARHAGLLSGQKPTWRRTEKSMTGKRMTEGHKGCQQQPIWILSRVHIIISCLTLPASKHLICSTCLPEMQLVQSSFSAPEQVLQDEWHSSQSPWTEGKQRKSM